MCVIKSNWIVEFRIGVGVITLSFPKILCKVQMHLLIPHKWIFVISVSSPTFPVWIPLRSKLPVWTSPLWQYQHMCLHINLSLSFWLSVHVPQGSFRCFAWRAVWFWQVPYSPVYMAWIEHKVNMSSLMVGQTTRQSTFLHRECCRSKSRTEFQHSGIWSFCLKGLISLFSGVLTMRLFLTVQLRQSCLSGPWVQPVLCNRVKSTKVHQDYWYVPNKYHQASPSKKYISWLKNTWKINLLITLKMFNVMLSFFWSCFYIII